MADGVGSSQTLWNWTRALVPRAYRSALEVLTRAPTAWGQPSCHSHIHTEMHVVPSGRPRRTTACACGPMSCGSRPYACPPPLGHTLLVKVRNSTSTDFEIAQIMRGRRIGFAELALIFRRALGEIGSQSFGKLPRCSSV